MLLMWGKCFQFKATGNVINIAIFWCFRMDNSVCFRVSREYCWWIKSVYSYQIIGQSYDRLSCITDI